MNDFQALGATMRPVDALSSSGAGWLTGQVNPLQQVLDQLAGKPAVIEAFVRAWQQVAERAEQVKAELGRSVAADTSEWNGSSAEAYRKKATDIGSALSAIAAASKNIGSVATEVGGAAAKTRDSVREQIQKLVEQLISLVMQAMAAQGGLTPAVVSQAASLISAQAAKVSESVNSLQQKINGVQPRIGQMDSGLGNVGRQLADMSGNRAGAQQAWSGNDLTSA